MAPNFFAGYISGQHGGLLKFGSIISPAEKAGFWEHNIKPSREIAIFTILIYRDYFFIYRDNFFTFLQTHEYLHVFGKLMNIFTSLANSWRSSRLWQTREDLHVFGKFMKIFTFLTNSWRSSRVWPIHEDLHDFAKSWRKDSGRREYGRNVYFVIRMGYFQGPFSPLKTHFGATTKNKICRAESNLCSYFLELGLTITIYWNIGTRRVAKRWYEVAICTY